MASWLLSIASELLKYPAETLDTVRAWSSNMKSTTYQGMAYFVIFKLGLKLEPENVGQVMQLLEIGIYWNRAHVVLLLLKTQDLWNNYILLS